MLRSSLMSHPQARPPVRARHLPRQKPEHAFTLVELLAVIAIIGILCAITFGIVKGVNERAAIGQAKSELSVLAQSLEAYKRQYGDYPWTGGAGNVANATAASDTDSPGILFNAVTGTRGPTGTALTNGKIFVDAARLTLQDSTTTPMSTKNAFLDPWGRRYLYYYKTADTYGSPTKWTKNPSYILLSVGPSVKSDGSAGITVSADGSYTVDATYGPDNIYANQ